MAAIGATPDCFLGFWMWDRLRRMKCILVIIHKNICSDANLKEAGQ